MINSSDVTWFADTAQRLFHDYKHRHQLAEILDVARECRAHLHGSGVADAALPELVERLARQRLSVPNHTSSNYLDPREHP